MKNITLNSNYIKKIFTVVFSLFVIKLFSQPILHPHVFEDDYKGFPDSTMLLAKVKTHKVYYESSQTKVKFLYKFEKFNTKGQMVSQKWYNFISHKEMYSANYEYDNKGFFTLSNEKITSELDNFAYYSRKKNDIGYFVNGNVGNPMGETIPKNEKGEVIVNTIYTKDSFGGYIAKKYFYDKSFYKEKICPSWQYNQHLYNGLYIDKNKSIDFYYSKVYFMSDTIASGDSLNIMIKNKGDNKEYFKILKKKNSQTKEFEIREIDIVVDKLKLYFSAKRFFGSQYSQVYSITYVDISNFRNTLLLEHRLIDDYDNLKQKIWLKEINNIKQLHGMNGALYYTSFKNGYLFQEKQFSLDNTITKMQEKHYGENNLLLSVTAYKSHYSEVFGPFSESFQNSYKEDSIEEVHEYEYFQ